MSCCLTCNGKGMVGYTLRESYSPTVVCPDCKGSGVEKKVMNKDIIIIAFIGKKLSGKTTAGKHMVKKYDYVRLRFADTLKNMLYEFGLSEAEVDGELKEVPCVKLGGKTPVQAMQTLGTEWGRDLIYPNIWVDALNRELEFMMEHKLTRFVIDDLRFISELEYLNNLREKYRVKTVRIERIGTSRGEHRSETEMDSMIPDSVILNNEGLELLYSSLDTMIEQWAKE